MRITDLARHKPEHAPSLSLDVPKAQILRACGYEPRVASRHASDPLFARKANADSGSSGRALPTVPVDYLHTEHCEIMRRDQSTEFLRQSDDGLMQEISGGTKSGCVPGRGEETDRQGVDAVWAEARQVSPPIAECQAGYPLSGA